MVGIRDGFDGLLFPERSPGGRGMIHLERDVVRGIAHLGGTILGSTNRGNPTAYPVQQADGTRTTLKMKRQAGAASRPARTRWR